MANDPMTRTRFLNEFDRMLRVDREGAIADMLQVLRENDVLQTISSNYLHRAVLGDDESFARAVKQMIGGNIGQYLVEDSRIAFSKFSTDTPSLVEARGSIEIVVKGSRRC